jgi:hypothetical protein
MHRRFVSQPSFDTGPQQEQYPHVKKATLVASPSWHPSAITGDGWPQDHSCTCSQCEQQQQGMTGWLLKSEHHQALEPTCLLSRLVAEPVTQSTLWGVPSCQQAHAVATGPALAATPAANTGLPRNEVRLWSPHACTQQHFTYLNCSTHRSSCKHAAAVWGKCHLAQRRGKG